jgi:hypothetical protein
MEKISIYEYYQQFNPTSDLFYCQWIFKVLKQHRADQIQINCLILFRF